MAASEKNIQTEDTLKRIQGSIIQNPYMLPQAKSLAALMNYTLKKLQLFYPSLSVTDWRC